ncbi:MAG: cob(I)yrinic acid a,c-diamide adenosyltransferase [Clostridia bacterium]|nr:cob(I)yrinic acid a,c-diamide adenosyltransferase [Clostridia bacterium]MDH7572321.1 cob(I)yrinic acid a,c-diamide adenosyltransferase [Clostridia bacterium]
MAFGAGLVQVYTGEGKGKSTAAFGLALRAWGQGLRVLIVQFMKPGGCGEHRALELFAPRLEVRSFGRSGFVGPQGPQEEDLRLAREALEYARQVMLQQQADLIILDEVLVAVRLGVLTVPELLEFLRQKPETVELVLTGRGAPAEIVERADLVTEMREVKHPYRSGVGPRRGIEY